MTRLRDADRALWTLSQKLGEKQGHREEERERGRKEERTRGEEERKRERERRNEECKVG